MSLPSDRQQRVDAICHAALDLPPPARAAFLRDACRGDEGMRREIESLLAREARAEVIFEQPVGAVAARVMKESTPGQPPALSAGMRVGPYEVVSLLGVGGMGEVYRARDSKLRRDVALKVIPDALAGDPERLMRFEREARVLAAFSHPNIAQIYGFEESGGRRALAIELVEGADLTRLLRATMPLDQAVALMRQIVDALAAAHEKGIVHRDLKPSNIMVTPAGQVKVLDFGLAKAAEWRGASESSSAIDSWQSDTDRVLGTAAYMSPEQATGRPVDKRTDIWALGCVMFEMLTGVRAFSGESPAEILANVLRTEPDWSRLPHAVPVAVRRVLTHCLAKDPQARVADVSIVRYVLDDATDVRTQAPAAAAPSTWTRHVPWAVAAAAVVALAVVLVSGPLPSADVSPGPGELRTSIALPSGVQLPPIGDALALSPDGSTLVYRGVSAEGPRLYKRRLSEAESTPIDGTLRAGSPFFSPDGNWLGFRADAGGLYRVPIAGGQPVKIVDVDAGAGSWGEDGYVVFGRAELGLFRVPASGGALEQVTAPSAEDQGNDHRYPQALPGGRGVLFSVGTGPEDAARIVVLDARTGTRTTLVQGSASARYVRTGHLVYARNGDLFAYPFDLERLALTGSAVRIAQGVAENTDGTPEYAFSADGTLVYAPGRAGGSRDQLTLVDLKGRAEATSFPPGPIVDPRFSPDGGRIALTLVAAKNNTWIYDLARRTPTKVTYGRYHSPVWTPEGRLTMAFGPRGQSSIVTRAADGEPPDDELLPEGGMQFPSDWTRDGGTLFYEQRTRETSWDIWMFSAGTRTPSPVVATRFPERYPRVSPDGKWLAYVSAENDRWDVYIRSLTGPAQRQQASVDGALVHIIAWAPDGRRLYYLARDRAMWMAEVTTSPSLVVGRQVRLFGAGEYDGVFDLAPDGKQFAMVRREPLQPRQTIELVVNRLRPRAGTR